MALWLAASFFGAVATAHAAGPASNITGVYYTGVSGTYGLLNGGSTDSHWSVTYASVNGGSSADPTYQGAAYVVDATNNNPGHTNYIDGGWAPNTNGAQWIVPPGAMTAQTGGTVNAGGVYLPGNGGTGAAGLPNNTNDKNEGVYIYTLAFTISGTGSGTVSNNVAMFLTIAADDQYAVYVNPTGNGASIPTGTAAATGTNAWGNTTSIALANYNGTAGGNSVTNNSTFKLGTNYLVIVVDNTNSATGNSGSTTINPSGLLMYNYADFIGGAIVPEVGAWLPVAGAVGLYGLVLWRRSRRRSPLLIQG